MDLRLNFLPRTGAHPAGSSNPALASGTGSTPMSDAIVFSPWRAGRRLLERGARTTIWQAVALGLLDRVEANCTGEPQPPPDEITNAFWAACRGEQRQTADHLLDRSTDLNWIGHDQRTLLQAAQESGANDLIQWLRNQGARLANKLQGESGRPEVPMAFHWVS
jgi:hypothetical protein